jgi:hypothetical protein
MAVLAACALMLFGLVKLDAAAADRQTSRARETLAEQAKAARDRPAEPKPEPRAPGTETSIGERGPIVLPVGGAWSGGTASAVAHTEYVRAPGPNGTLSRTVEPQTTVPATVSKAPPLLVENFGGQQVLAATPRVVAENGPSPSLLALFAGCGIIMSLAGTALLLRIPR